MKFWKGTGTKAGQIGTMDDNGHVPDSIEATQAEYEAWIAAQAAQPAPTDFKTLFAQASTADAKIQVLANKLGLL